MARERREGVERRPVADEDGFWSSVLPDTALGLATLLFFMAVAAAFSGAALFAYYRFELDDTRGRVAELEGEISDDLAAAEQRIGERTDQATGEIEELLQELEQYSASGQTVEELVAGAGPSVFFLSTLDEAGQPSVGTAFVLFSDSERSFLLTSYTTIRAHADGWEAVDAGWWRPRGALSDWQAGRIELIEPTVASLRLLAEHARASDAMAALHAADPVDGAG